MINLEGPGQGRIPCPGSRRGLPGSLPLKYPEGNTIVHRGSKMAVDPACKMTVDEKTAKVTSEYKGKKYYFCNPGCKKKFDADPAKYAK